MTDLSISDLFQGSLYIDKKYGVSCATALITDFLGKSTNKKLTEAEVITTKVSEISTQEGNNGPNKVVVINFNQPVLKYTYGSWLGTQTYMTILDRYKNDPDVAGVVLNIDSGGGQVYGTGQFYDYLVDYPKPYVAYTHGYMCSGAYYIAAPADYIIADKRADAIGSIGAYSTIVDGNGILEHFGAKVHTIYATKSTEKNKSYREVIEEGNYESYIKEDLDPIVDDFHADMKAVRPDLSQEVFAGGTWTGKNSLDKKLIDQLGTLEDAINKVIELSNNNKSKTQNNMSTQRERIQAVLGLEEPLATTDNGSYLNEAQLDSIEEQLTANADTIATLTAQLEEAQNATSEDLQVAQTTIAGIETSVNSMLKEAGLDVQGTLDEKVDSLSAKVTEMANADGAAPTKVKTKEKSAAEVSAFQIDANASHNQIANNLHN